MTVKVMILLDGAVGLVVMEMIMAMVMMLVVVLLMKWVVEIMVALTIVSETCTFLKVVLLCNVLCFNGMESMKSLTA